MQNSPQDLRKKILGRKGEKLAEKFLKKSGMKILKRNYNTPFGEADLISADGDEIVFVEVKTRTGDSFGEPKEAVTAAKRRRYENIAKFYWLQEGKEPNVRFDVIEVRADGKELKIEHYKNAF